MHEVELRACFDRAGLTEDQKDHVLEMISESPSRQPGGAALDNVIVLMSSKKNRRSIWLESHTVERLYAYELEFDPSVIAYFTQVRCRGIERTGPDRKRHVGSATADFLVIRSDSVTVVECKTGQRVSSLLQQFPHEWVRSAVGSVERPAFQQWAAHHGLDYRVWVQPDQFACVLANYELLYSIDPRSEHSREQILAIASLETCPKTIEHLLQDVPRLTPKDIHQLLRNGDIFGPILSVTLDETDTFTLFRDRVQCDAAQALGSTLSAQRLQQAADALSTSSFVDLQAGRARLARLASMRRGERPYTRRYRQLDKKVAIAIASGKSELEACLTNYRASGNRTRRLVRLQEEALVATVQRWEAGTSFNRENAYIEHVIDCKRRGCTPVTKTTLNRYLARANRAKRDLRTGGIRQYQKSRVATDPRARSLAAIGVGLRLQIDSTIVDNRVFPGLEDILLLDRPIIYVAIDNSTRHPACYELAFGPARSDALASLLRTYVRKHGRLPSIIQVDRGTENRSNWLAAFCSIYGITLLIHPTAASVFNSSAENWIGRINSELHRLPGSTAPDQRGRAVDGRFKSRKTAKLQFSALLTIIEEVVEHLGYVPGADGVSPMERREELLIATGLAGRPTNVDEDFLYHSSIPIRASRIDPKRGIKTERYTYASAELLEATRRGDVVEVRRDCEDAGLIRAQMNSGRYKAWAPFAVKLANLPPLDVKFLSYYLYQRGSAVVQRRLDAHVSLHQRTDMRLSETTATATEPTPAATSKGARPVARPASHDLSLPLDSLRDYNMHSEGIDESA